ncbi:MAG: type I secretion system permease/ATPase [Pseudomonadales bacterium]
MTSETITSLADYNQDPLLDALVALTRIHARPWSAESLCAGLPLVDGKLTPALFVRAAERAGFIAEAVNRELDDIPDEVLPCALIGHDGSALILLERTGDEAVVSDPIQPGERYKKKLTELKGLYAGQCLYVKPEYHYNDMESGDAGEAHWFWQTIKRSRGLYAEVLVASLLINLFALVSPLFIMNVYDRVVPNYAVETLWVLASGVFIVFIFDLIMKSLRGYFIDVAGKRADILLSSKTFSRVMDIKMSERPRSVGSFANNLHEFDTFREFFTSTTLVAVIDLPFVLLFILLIYGIGGVLAVIPLIAIPLVVIVGLIFQRPLRETITKTFAESARKHAMLIESLSALDAIKGARAEGGIQRKWEEYNARLARLGLKSRLLSLGTVNVAQAVQQFATVAVVIGGVYLIMEARLSIGGLIACTILTGRCMAPMSQLASILTRYHHSVAAYGAIDRIMSLPVERPSGHKFLHRSRLDGDIEFKQVSFAYPEQQEPALKDVSFTIRAGEKVGIIGRMGSGKSTIHKLLLKFYQPASGSILVSGTDINQIDPNDLRTNINFVPQDIVLLNSTIRENIVVGSPLSSDETVLRAAELAGLSELVNRHPQGFDLIVGERGANLSGGQRQAVGIARAFIDRAPLILLDEPTNAMDNSSEATFKQQLKAYAEHRTLVLVTHKTSLLSLVDRLIVLNAGEVVADGPRDEILGALSGGAG